MLVTVIDTKQNLEIMEKEEQRFYASEIEESLNENVCYIADRTNDDASKGLTMITLTYSDREELEERVEQILQTLNK